MCSLVCLISPNFVNISIQLFFVFFRNRIIYTLILLLLFLLLFELGNIILFRSLHKPNVQIVRQTDRGKERWKVSLFESKFPLNTQNAILFCFVFRVIKITHSFLFVHELIFKWIISINFSFSNNYYFHEINTCFFPPYWSVRMCMISRKRKLLDKQILKLRWKERRKNKLCQKQQQRKMKITINEK